MTQARAKLVLFLVALGAAACAVWLVARTAGSERRGAGELRDAQADSSDASPDADALAAPRAAAPPGVAPGDAGTRAPALSAYERELAEGQWVEGRVVFPPGTPLDEEPFVVALGFDFEHGPDHRVPVAPDGSFRVAFSQRAQLGRLGLEARFLLLEEKLRLKLAHLPEEIVLEPTLGARIEGALVLPPGADPASAAGTEIQSIVWRMVGAARKQGPSGGTVVVDDELRFELGPLPPKLTFELTALPERFTAASRTGLELVPGEVTRVELVLRSGATVAGRVVDEAGTALPDAVVRATTEGAPRLGMREAATDVDGRFRLAGLVPGPIRIGAVADDLLPAEETVTATQDGEVVDGLLLRLERGLALSGTVSWPDGTPVEAAKLLLEPMEWDWGAARTAPLERELDVEGGVFEVGGLRDVPYTLLARARPPKRLHPEFDPSDPEAKLPRVHLTASLTDLVPGGPPIAIVIEPGAAVTGRVVDDAGQPLERFRVRAVRPDTADLLAAKESERFRDPDGRFTYTGLEPGTWTLTASAPGHVAIESDPVEVVVPGAAPVRLVVPRGAAVAGAVLDSAGRPVPDATVAFEDRHGRWRSYRGETATTDARGEFVLESVRSGDVNAWAEAAGFASSPRLALRLAPAERREGVRLELTAGGTIAGRAIALDGSPAARREIDLVPEGGNGWAQAETDELGRFRFERLVAARYRLRMDPTPSERADERSRGAVQRSVDVVEGETVEVVLDASGADLCALRGRVTRAGRPVEDASVVVTSDGPPAGNRWDSDRTDADGAFELRVTAPAEVVLTVTGDDFELSEPLSVPAASELVHDVAVPAGSIAGRVTDEAGDALRLVPVQATTRRADGGESSASARTDAAGRYVVEGLAAGSYRVLAGGDPGWHDSPWTRDFGPAERTVELAESDATTGIDFVLARGVRIEGVVRSAAGAPLARAGVVAWGGDGSQVDTTRTDDEGRFEFAGLSAGTVSVAAVATGGAAPPTAIADVPPGDHLEIELVARPATDLVLRATQGSAPVAGASFEVRDAAGRDWSRARELAFGSWGAEPVLPLPPGTYRVAARKGAASSAPVTVVLTGAEPERVVTLALDS